MVLNDILANALSKLGQYEQLGRQDCIIDPSSKVIAGVLNTLKKFHYIKGYERVKEGKKEHFKVKLTGNINNIGVIKPRHAVKYHEFENFEKRYMPSKDMGLLIVSTTEGVMDHNKVKEKKIGGKLLAYCY